MQQSKISRWWLTVGVLAALVILAAVIPSPYAIQRPGPVVNALGEIETEAGTVAVVRIDGTDTFGTDGSLNVLSISIIGSPEKPASWLTVAGTWFDPSRRIVPMEEVFPAGLTSEQRTERNAAMMVDSQTQATAAALNELGEGFEGSVTVAAVTPGGPVHGVLHDGDEILSINGSPVRGLGGLRAAIAANEPGAAVTIRILRHGSELDVQATPALPEGYATPMLGVAVHSEFAFPFEVELELDRIGGPSAGLIFALAVYDSLTPGALAEGLTVSGTGTIDDAGAVGSIGGLEQKIWGALNAGSDLMLMPIANCVDLPDRLPDGVRVAPVATLGEAIAAIETVGAGGEPVGLERCAAVLRR